MTEQDIMKELAVLVRNELDIAADVDLRPETLPVEIGLDSIALMSLLVYAEERFGFEAGEDALLGENFACLGDIARYIADKKNNSQTGE